MHLRDVSANETDFAAEKLELAFASCLCDELEVTVQRVETLLRQHPALLVQVLLRGRKLLQTSHMMPVEDTCVEQARCALATKQEAMEEVVMGVLVKNDKGDLKAMCDAVCKEGSAALQKRMMQWLVRSGQSAVLVQLDEAAAAAFLTGGDYGLLHSVYVTHGHLMKAATLLFEVCVLEQGRARDAAPLTLKQRHEGIGACLRDLEDLERSGALDRAPYADMAAPRLRALLKRVELQQQLHGVNAAEAVEPVEAVQEECAAQRRFDLVLACLVLRGDSAAERVEACWTDFIRQCADSLVCAEAVVASVVALMETVRDPAFLPLQTILSCLVQLGFSRESQAVLLASRNRAEVPAQLLALLDTTAEEKGRVAVGALIETWVRGLPAEERAREEVRYLVEVTSARLASVVEFQEEAEKVRSDLLALWSVCWEELQRRLVETNTPLLGRGLGLDLIDEALAQVDRVLIQLRSLHLGSVQHTDNRNQVSRPSTHHQWRWLPDVTRLLVHHHIVQLLRFRHVARRRVEILIDILLRCRDRPIHHMKALFQQGCEGGSNGRFIQQFLQSLENTDDRLLQQQGVLAGVGGRADDPVHIGLHFL